MDSNTHSTSAPAGFSALVAELRRLAAQDLDGLTDGARAERVLRLRGLVIGWKASGWESWPRWTAGGPPAPTTASRPAPPPPGSGTASAWAPAPPASSAPPELSSGSLTATAEALADRELSPAHAQVLAAGTHDLPAHLAAEAEPVLVAAARRLDPPRLRRVVAHLRVVADPDTAQDRIQRRHQQRGLWPAATWEGWWP